MEAITLLIRILHILSLIIVAPVILIIIWVELNQFKYWLIKKLLLLSIGIKLISSKNKHIKSLGWLTLRLMLWETKQ